MAVGIQHLRHVLALAEQGSFRLAAEVLHISQPALTKSIQRIEDFYGVRLFDRHPKGVEPTAFGHLVVARAREVVGQLDSIKRDVDLLRGLEVGEVLVGSGPYPAEGLLAVCVHRLIERYPGLRFLIHVDNWRRLGEAVRRGELDLFVADMTDALTDEALETIELEQEDGVWFVGAGHPLRGRRRIPPSELATYPVAAPKAPAWLMDWLQRVFHETCEGLRLAWTVECDDYALVKRIVAQGRCFSAAPRSIVNEELERGVLIELDVAAPTVQSRTGIVFARNRLMPPAAEALVAELIHVSESRMPKVGR
jgi:DNA-binding transcriptional LysR family regulator